jgi:hypothetical protein
MEQRCRVCGVGYGFVESHLSDFCGACRRAMNEQTGEVRAIIFALCDRIKELEKQIRV